jgi:hypothetical protein
MADISGTGRPARFFTGGVTEGLNAKDEEFGDEQLIEVANACRGDDVSMIQQ